MVKGPSLYNPWRNPQNALERRNIVLKLMLEHKMIGDELYQLLSQRPLGVQRKGKSPVNTLRLFKLYKQIYAVNWANTKYPVYLAHVFFPQWI